jgi:hypothetical protein
MLAACCPQCTAAGCDCSASGCLLCLLAAGRLGIPSMSRPVLPTCCVGVYAVQPLSVVTAEAMPQGEVIATLGWCARVLCAHAQ